MVSPHQHLPGGKTIISFRKVFKGEKEDFLSLKLRFYSRLKNKVVNKLELSNLGRESVNSLYICQASNNNLSMPVSTSVSLDLSCNNYQSSSSFIPIF